MSKLGVVMVTYRAGARVTASLSALADARDRLPPEHELLVVIVDNASGDGTVERVRERAPWADLVELRANRGFAAGCNVGIGRAAPAEVIVLLNPDVEMASDFLARLASLEWPADIAARGPAILDGHGQVEQSARRFPRARTALLGRTSLLARMRPASPLLREELLADPAAGARPVDWVSGACLIAPAQRFGAVGLLDEGYFMYWEDADWCRRAHAMGYSVLYEPQLTATHHQGSSSRDRPVATTIAFHRSALRYWRKHVARSPASTALAAAALGVRCAAKLAAVAVRAAAARARATGSAP